MPVISVVTPVHNHPYAREYLAEAYESLCRQELPTGWSWQWVVQEDGTTGLPLSELPDDPRVSGGTGQAGGGAMARTLALARVHGVLLRALDADDLLPEGALSRDIETLMTHRELGWCVSACLDLLPDGTLTPGPHDPPAGPLQPGVLAQGLKEGKLQVMGTTLTAYTDLVRAVGGWMALPSEDVALLLTCEAVAKGWFIDQPGEIYRKWSGQQSANPDLHKQLSNRTHHEVLVTRADALRRAGWRWHPDTPEREVRPIPTRHGQAPP